MPNTEARKAYLRKYQSAWIKRRRRAWIRANGPCVLCGSRRQLEVDHVDPATKLYEVAAIWSLCVAKRELELAKCQVLCHKCHARKSASERHRSGLYDRMKIKAPEGQAWCYVRKHFAAVTDFGHNTSKRDSLQDECRECRNKKRRKKSRIGPGVTSSRPSSD